jgi:hypothetical protein
MRHDESGRIAVSKRTVNVADRIDPVRFERGSELVPVV